MDLDPSRSGADDRDSIDDDLDPICPRADGDPVTAGSQPRDGLERCSTAQRRREQVDERRRRLCGPAARFQLDEAVGGREFEVPEAGAVLDPAPERDAGPQQAPVGGVDVRGGERAAGKGPPAELRQCKAGLDVELQFLLACDLHGGRS